MRAQGPDQIVAGASGPSRGYVSEFTEGLPLGQETAGRPPGRLDNR